MIFGLPLVGAARQGRALMLRETRELFDAGRMAAGLSYKSAADALGMSPAHLSQSLNLHGLSLTRALWLPDPWWAPVLTDIAERKGCAHLLAKYQPVSAADVAALRAQNAELLSALRSFSSADLRRRA